MQTNQKGLTLIEVLAVVVVFSLVMTLTFQTLFSLVKQSDKLSSRFNAYSDANVTAKVILNSVYDMKLEKSTSCGTNCFYLINRPKQYIDDSGATQVTSEVRYTIRLNGTKVELLDDSNNIIIEREVTSSSTITSTCPSTTCLEAVITLDLYFEYDETEEFQSITTIAH